jgi:hypothetical protein
MVGEPFLGSVQKGSGLALISHAREDGVEWGLGPFDRDALVAWRVLGPVLAPRMVLVPWVQCPSPKPIPVPN